MLIILKQIIPENSRYLWSISKVLRVHFRLEPLLALYSAPQACCIKGFVLKMNTTHANINLSTLSGVTFKWLNKMNVCCWKSLGISVLDVLNLRMSRNSCYNAGSMDRFCNSFFVFRIKRLETQIYTSIVHIWLSFPFTKFSLWITKHDGYIFFISCWN